MDTIHIRHLTVTTIVGTLSTERTTPRQVVFNVEIGLDLSRAGHSDNLADTVNYQEIAAAITTLAAEKKYFLIEALAEAAAALILRRPGVKTVTLTLDKPGAIPDAAAVAVTMVRSNSSQ